jgi:protein FAM32A
MSYDFAGGSLKLKGLSDKEIKKKKKKSKKDKDKLKQAAETIVSKADLNDPNSNSSDTAAKTVAVGENSLLIQKVGKTKSELAFEQRLERRNEEKIFKKAEKSHKEHVEEFNKHLDSLSEYHDVPKVSWTK